MLRSNKLKCIEIDELSEKILMEHLKTTSVPYLYFRLSTLPRKTVRIAARLWRMGRPTIQGFRSVPDRGWLIVFQGRRSARCPNTKGRKRYVTSVHTNKKDNY